MGNIQLNYKNGEEYYICEECNQEIPEEMIEFYVYSDTTKKCPNCGCDINDVDFL